MSLCLTDAILMYSFFSPEDKNISFSMKKKFSRFFTRNLTVNASNESIY